MKLFGHFNFLLLLSIELHAGAFANFQIKHVVISSNLYNKNDRLFVKLLSHRWHDYSVAGRYVNRINVKPISTQSSTIDSIGPRVLVPVNPLHRQDKTKSSVEYFGNTTLNFLGSIIAFDIPLKLKQSSLHVKDKKNVIQFFDLIASSKYDKIIVRTLYLRKTMGLNDWGMFLLIHTLAQKLFQENCANIFTCFILNKLHYDVKVTLMNSHVALLIRSKDKLYNRYVYTIGHKKYYLFLNHYKNATNIFTYNINYPMVNKPFNFQLDKLPSLHVNAISQHMSFNYKGTKYKFLFTYNSNLLKFLVSYPQTEMNIYLHAPIEQSVYHQIAMQLANDIDGKRASDAMNFVLLFMQHVLSNHHTKANVNRLMFSEQTLYSGSLNSLNRCTLYVYVMHKLFDVSTVVAIYKHYVVAALNIPMKGYAFNVKGVRYVIADPSFINANIGQCRPSYKDIAPSKFIQ